MAAVVKLANNTYAGANHTHFTELLRDREGIDLSRPTVRRILAKAGMGSPRSRRSSQHRFRRRRMPQEGMLVQIDGSHHPWLEERGPKLVLLLAVDDATGVVAQAVFHTGEDTRGYLVLLEGLVRQWGIPLALYSDRHAAFKYNARQAPVLAESTQFARVMRELGIRLSCHRFVANQVRLWLFVLAYNLGNFMRRLTLPESVKHWSLRSVQTKLIKMGGRLVRHARRLVFQLAEVAVSREVFRQVLERIAGLHPAPG